MAVPSGMPLPAAVLELLHAGNTIEAIKLLRESSGLGLKEAKDTIDRYLRDPSGSTALPAASTATAPGASTLPADVVQAMRDGRKIEAIRLLREQTGMGLKDAKDAVEALPVEAMPLSALESQVRQSSRGTAVWMLVIAIVLVVAFYLWRNPG